MRNSLGVNKEEDVEDVPPALFLRREGGGGVSFCDDEDGRPVGIMDSLEERRKD